ncbi:hypothetical protein [Georgenia yuyongxinii]
MSDLPQARAAKEHLRAQLRGHDGVVGVGLSRTREGYCVKVNVSAPDIAERVPSSLDGVEVRVTVVGPISAQI